MTVADFFKKYHAVPCGNDGTPDYRAATDAALIGQCEADCRAWDAHLPPAVREQVRGRLAEQQRELTRRWKLLTGAEFDAALHTLGRAQLRTISRIGAAK